MMLVLFTWKLNPNTLHTIYMANEHNSKAFWLILQYKTKINHEI